MHSLTVWQDGNKLCTSNRQIHEIALDLNLILFHLRLNYDQNANREKISRNLLENHISIPSTHSIFSNVGYQKTIPVVVMANQIGNFYTEGEVSQQPVLHTTNSQEGIYAKNSYFSHRCKEYNNANVFVNYGAEHVNVATISHVDFNHPTLDQNF